jgi:filamentous hemagglutinin
VVASELARSRGKNSVSGSVKSTVLLSALVSVGLMWPTTGIADVISANNATQIYTSTNGVPIVDIAGANANGLSHNRFTQYNVDSRGLVLNNNANANFTPAPSELAGQVQVNPNLNNAAAVILNEVVAANRSTLVGYTEVAGAKADVIVANPWGITCGGCGFINTDRVTLSTGTPIFTNGDLTGLEIKQGDVLINGSGANLSAQQMFDIVARSVTLDGQVNANDIKLIAGTNEWDLSSRTAAAINTLGVTSDYAIDSTMLGGMYAGRIELIATEAGVGVRMRGDAAASTGSFTLTAEGKIELNNTVSAKQDIVLTSTSNIADAITLTDTSLAAEQNIQLSANNGGAIISGGIIKANDTLDIRVESLSDVDTLAPITDNNKRYANTVNIKVADTTTITNVSYGALESLTINTGTLDLGTGTTALYSDNGAMVVTAAADMVLGSAAIKSNTGMELTSTSGSISTISDENQRIKVTAGDLKITMQNQLNNAGIIEVEEGGLSIVGNDTGQKILNNGTLYGSKSIYLNLGQINNSGLIVSDGTLGVQASDVTNTGKIQAKAKTEIKTDVLINDGLLITSSTPGNSSILETFFITNNSLGIIQSQSDLTVNVKANFTNSGKILSAEDLNFFYIGGSLNGEFNNIGTGSIQAGNALNINRFSAVTVATDSTLLGNTFNIDTAEFTNRGTVQGLNGESNITSNRLINTATVQSNGNLSLNIRETLINNGRIVSTNGNIVVRGTDPFYTLANSVNSIIEAKTGLIDIKGQFGFKGVDVTNSSIIKGNTLQITAGILSIAGGGQLDSVGTMLIDVNTLLMPVKSTILTGGMSSFILGNNLINNGIIHSKDSLTISYNTAPVIYFIQNRLSSSISAINTLNITGADFYNSGIVYSGLATSIISPNNLENYASGEIISGGNVTLTSSYFNNNNKIVAEKNIIISSTDFNNQIAGGDTRILISTEAQANFVYDPWPTPCPDPCVLFVTSEDGVKLELGINQSRNYSRSWTETQSYNGNVPNDKNRPQITSTTGDITISDFTRGLNLAGIISGVNVKLEPATVSNTGFTQFKHDAYSLRSITKTETYTDTITWSGTFGAISTFSNKYLGIADSKLQYTTFLSNSGIYARDTFTSIAPGLIFSIESDITGSDDTNVDTTSNIDPASATSASNINVSTNTAVFPITIDPLFLALPSSPNGFFITSKNPSSGYLIETNPLFQVGSTFGGSDFFVQRYGFDPEVLQKRLGDANYEAYLIRQQLISQTGNNMLAGYETEAVLLQSMMEQGADEALRLGFIWGTNPTLKQLADLTTDIVWMVEVTINGEKVLAPKVFLSQNTKDNILSGAVIAAGNIDISVASFNNTGGTVAANEKLAITAVNNVTNTSGKIIGGDVSLVSTEGSIINQTWSETTGGEGNTNTIIGRTASIESRNTLLLSAEKDIKILGATLTSGGKAALKAGNDIIVDTIVDRTSTSSSSGSNNSATSTTTTTVKNIGSALTFGSDLALESGNQTTIAGSVLEVNGNLDVDANGGFSVIARQDSVTTNTIESTAGMGVGGGVFGSETTTTDNFVGTNAGSTLVVKGNANIDSDGTFLLQGSDVNIDGNADINAVGGISILDGLDEVKTTTVTQTTAFLKGEGNAVSDVMSTASSSAKSLNADAATSANAIAESDHDFKLQETTTTTTNSGSKTSVASTLNVKGNLKAETAGALTVQGSVIDVGGDATLAADRVEVLTGRNETWDETVTDRTSVGFFAENDAAANAGTETEANANGVLATNAGASATANASASSVGTMGVLIEQDTSTNYALTNSKSVIKIGGSGSITAANTARFVGAEIETGKALTIVATDIINEAAIDVIETTSTSNRDLVGVYLSGQASAQASAEANAQTGLVTGVDGSVQASAEAEAGAGLRYNNQSSTTSQGSTTVVGNSFKAGTDFSRTATNLIVDQATDIEATRDFNQSANVIRDEAVQDTTYSTSDTSEHDARIGVYAGAKVEAGAEAGMSSVGMQGGSSDAGAEAGAGLQAQYENEYSYSSSESTTAVTSRFKAGGNINSTSKEATTLVGAELIAGGDININAGSFDFLAAEDTSTSTRDSSEVSVDGKVSLAGSVGAKLDASYGGGSDTESSSKARVGTVTASNNLNITTKKDATFVGTNMEAGNQANLDVGGSLDVQAARDTTSSSGSKANVSLSVSSTVKDQSVGIGGGYENNESSSSTAVVGIIKSGAGGTQIKSAGDATFEGTQFASDGDTSLSAGGAVNLNAAKNTTSDVNFEFSGDAGKGKGGDVEGVVGGGVSVADSTASTTVGIQSLGSVSIVAKNINNQAADINSTNGTETLTGIVTNTEAENSEFTFGAEARIKSGGDSPNNTGTPGATRSGPDGADISSATRPRSGGGELSPATRPRSDGGELSAVTRPRSDGGELSPVTRPRSDGGELSPVTRPRSEVVTDRTANTIQTSTPVSPSSDSIPSIASASSNQLLANNSTSVDINVVPSTPSAPITPKAADPAVPAVTSTETVNPNVANQIVPAVTSTETITPTVVDPVAQVVGSTETVTPNAADPVVPAVTPTEAVNPNIDAPVVSVVTSTETITPPAVDPVAPVVASTETVTPKAADPVVPAVTSTETVNPNVANQIVPAVTSTETITPTVVDPVAQVVGSTETVTPNAADPVVPAVTPTEAVNPNIDAPVVSVVTSTETITPPAVDPVAPVVASTETVTPKAADPVVPAVTSTETITPTAVDPVAQDVASTATVTPKAADPVIPAVTPTETVNPNIDAPVVSVVTSTETITPPAVDPVAPVVASTETVTPKAADPVVPAVTPTETVNPNIDAPVVSVVTSTETITPKAAEPADTETVHGVSKKIVDTVRAIPKGQRPDPSTYLAKETIDNQLAEFDGGASYLVSKAAFDRFSKGKDNVGRPDGQFVMSGKQLDALLLKADGDLALIEKELGIPEGSWQGQEFVRIDIPDPRSLSLRLPDGNESGANDLWVPGGKLPTGQLEAVVNQIPTGSYTETSLTASVQKLKDNAAAATAPTKSVTPQPADPTVTETVANESGTPDSEGTGLRARDRLRKSVLAAEGCVEQTLEDGQVICIQAE